MFIQWFDRYSVGIDHIDEQHKCLLDLINVVYEFFLKKENRKIALEHELVKTIKKFYNEHAKAEEDIMLRFDYPNYLEHKSKHDAIKEIAESFFKDLTGDSHIDYEAFFNFINDWIFEHFSTEDLKLADFVKNRELGYEEEL